MHELYRILLSLKSTKRTGWLDRGVPRDGTESVADHAYVTAMFAWMVAQDDPALDADRVLQLAMVHDLAEAITGDPPPYHDDEKPDPADREALVAFFSVRHLRSPEEKAAKHEAEQDAMMTIVSRLAERTRIHIVALWQEYEAQETPEARFVKDVDRLEAFLQSRAYLRMHPGVPVGGFEHMAMTEICHPALAAIRDAELATPLTSES